MTVFRQRVSVVLRLLHTYSYVPLLGLDRDRHTIDFKIDIYSHVTHVKESLTMKFTWTVIPLLSRYNITRTDLHL